MMRYSMRAVLIACAVALWVTTAMADSFQGFEVDDSSWTYATRVASGTNGITSKTGNWHAEALQSPFPDGSAYTFWNLGDGTVPLGFVSSVDIYLDLSSGASNDTRIDWDVALQDVNGALVRDFVFNGGYYDQMSLTGSGPRFVFSTGNSFGRPYSYPEDPNHDPFAITSSGWYTFQHHFVDDNGALKVDMVILDANGNVLKTWTVNSGDPVGPTCCSAYYDWFANQEFETLAFDNVALTQDAPVTPVPEPATVALVGLGLAGVVRRRSR